MRKRSPILGLALATVAAAIMFALPQSVLDGAAAAIDAGSAVPQMAPPLGTTARALLALAAFLIVFLLVAVARRPRRLRSEPVAAEEAPERDFFADTPPYSLDPPSAPAAVAVERPALSEPAIKIPPVRRTAADLLPDEKSAPAVVTASPPPTLPPAEIDGLRNEIGQIAADVATLRAQQAVEADDPGATLQTIQLTEALRSVESLLREQKNASINPAEQLRRLEARLDSISAKIDALSARPGLAAPADPDAARRVSSALAELRQTLAR